MKIDGVTESYSTISALLMTYYNAQDHHNNYNICYKSYPIKVGKYGSEDEHRKYTCDGCRQHTKQRAQYADRNCSSLGLHIRGATLPPQVGWGAYTKHRDLFKNSLTIGLKTSCMLPSMTYGAEKTSTEQTSGPTDQNEKNYAT